MYKYLEIVEDETEEVSLRMDVTNQSQRSIDKIERGMKINLNHKEFSTRQIESETKLKLIE